MNELISVIVNVYNGQDYITKCLDSIISQTYKNIEIIIVNDGSTDDTLKICKSYKDKRIRIINQKNIGISLSRNVGIDNAKGEYIFFVDSDDIIEKDMIEYLYNLNKKNNTLMSICMSKDIYNYEYNKEEKEEVVDIVSGKDVLKKILLSVERNGNVWGKLTKKEVYDGLRFQDRKISDIVVIYKLVMKLDRISYSNQVKYYYLRHANSIVSNHNTEWAKDLYDGAIERYNDIKQTYSDMIENDICILMLIIDICNYKDKEVDKYLKKKNAKKLYNKLFSFKILKYRLPKKDKFKIILYRISPKLLRFITRLYIKIKAKKQTVFMV